MQNINNRDSGFGKTNSLFNLIIQQLDIDTRFCCIKNIRLNSTHCLAIKISKKQELQKIACNHSPDIDFENFINLYKKYMQNHILF